MCFSMQINAQVDPVFSIIATELGNINEGTTTIITISLSDAPTSDVTLSITAGGHVSEIMPTELTFTSINYNNGMNVSMRVADNTFVGDVPLEVTISVIGGPSEYSSLPELVISGTIIDEATDQTNLPTAGIERDRSKSLDEIIEGGDTDPSNNGLPIGIEDDGLDFFNVRLLAQPSQEVTLTTSVAAEAKIAAVNPAELIFDSFNWDDYQSFQVGGR